MARWVKATRSFGRVHPGNAWKTVRLPRISTLARGTVHTWRRTRMSACSGGTRQFYMPTQELDIQSESGHKIIDTPGCYRLHGRLTLPISRWCRTGRFLRHDDDEGKDVECSRSRKIAGCPSTVNSRLGPR